jgi:tRNA-dihydrouridine synthase
VKENPRIKIPVFGNGDIDAPEKAVLYKNTYGVDGIMIGRAAIGYPWIFNEIKHFIKTGEHLPPPTIQQRVDVIRQHLHRSVEWKGLKPGINEMRRHYTNYLKGLPNIKEFRLKLVTITEVEQIDRVLQEIVLYYDGFQLTPRKVEMEAMAYSCE